MDKNSEPVRRSAALTAFGTAVVNVGAILFEFQNELTAALNILIGAGVGVWYAFGVRNKVEPV